MALVPPLICPVLIETRRAIRYRDGGRATLQNHHPNHHLIVAPALDC